MTKRSRILIRAKSILQVLVIWTAGLGLSIAQDSVHVGVYRDKGAGRSVEAMLRVLRGIDGCYIRILSAEDIQQGRLKGLHVLLFPGGSGGKQGRTLTDQGRSQVREFVRSGGGYLGVCAGAYLATNDYDWSLNLLNAQVIDRRHWARGTGKVQVQLTSEGKRLLQRDEDTFEIYFGNGPLLAPAQTAELEDYRALASYLSEIAKNGAPTGVMSGTTAIAYASFGQGKVLVFGVHPEMTEGLDGLERRALELLRPVTEKVLPLPQFVQDQGRTPDVSQRGLPNANYCAPCAAANLLERWQSERLVELRQVDVKLSSDGSGKRDRTSALAELLGEEAYMETKRFNGTNRYRLVNGLDRLLQECGASELKVHYLGLRPYERDKVDESLRSRLIAVEGVPRLIDLQRGIVEGDGVAILFGSYKSDSKSEGRLERVGGHYVVATGYGQRENTPSANCIALHDSNDGLQGEKYVQAIQVDRPLELWDNGRQLAASSKLLRLEGAPIRKDGRIAFLETIFTFRFSNQ